MLRPEHRFCRAYDDARKNVRLLLRALRRVRQTIPAATLTLIGTRRVPEGLRNLAAELGIADAVTFLEELDQET